VLEIAAAIESELAALEEDEAKEFMADLGLAEPGLNRLIQHGYDLLGLMSFLTAGHDEVRAWSIRKGTRAQDAAREIHSDIARGFIRAEIISFADLMETRSWAAAKEKGLARLEGRDYIMLDGDVVNFRFQV
jgi:ribosome-binding ATPase YchF (GTP1/OBG family)